MGGRDGSYKDPSWERIPNRSDDPSRWQPCLTGIICCPCVFPFQLDVMSRSGLKDNMQTLPCLVDGSDMREGAFPDDEKCQFCYESRCCEFYGIRGYPFGWPDREVVEQD